MRWCDLRAAGNAQIRWQSFATNPLEAPDDDQEEIGLPTNTTQLAALAVGFHDLFIDQHDDGTATTLRLPDVQGVRVELTRRVDARRRR